MTARVGGQAPKDHSSRVGWMDGLRGVAAVQVVLLHYASAFMPSIGLFNPKLIKYGWSILFINTPLSYLFDGYSAVSLFFILSGVALTYSFSMQPYALASGAGRRVVRLGVPMVFSIVLAAVFWFWLPEQHIIAARVTGSEEWLGSLTPGNLSVVTLIHEGVLEGMLAGFKGSSMLPWRWQLALGLHLQNIGLNPVLWTLHAELYGSLLILCLVALRRSCGDKLHIVLCAIVAAVFSKSLILLFLVGHIAAFCLPGLASSDRSRRFGFFVCLIGVVLCSMQTSAVINAIFGWSYTALPTPMLGPAVTLPSYQGAIGAALVFIGMAMTPKFQHVLERPFFRWLGKISFSLYLTHFSLLFTVVCAIFNAMSQHYSYGICVAVSTSIGISLSFGIAVVFERFVDKPSVAWSRKIGRPRRLVLSGPDRVAPTAAK